MRALTQNPILKSRVPSDMPPLAGKGDLFEKWQLRGLYYTLGLLGVSSVPSVLYWAFPGIFGNTNSYLYMLVFVWYVGALVGLLLILTSFIKGLMRLSKDKGRMLLNTFVLGAIFVFASYGTCVANLAVALKDL